MTNGMRGRALQRARAGYGAALVLAPGLAIYLATGRFPHRRARRVAQLLGTRHQLQAAVTSALPSPDVFALGAEVDTVHATSMLVLAADPAARPAAVLDALAEAVFAAIGFSASVQTPEGDLVQ